MANTMIATIRPGLERMIGPLIQSTQAAFDVPSRAELSMLSRPC
jgi:hypothetical protein